MTVTFLNFVNPEFPVASHPSGYKGMFVLDSVGNHSIGFLVSWLILLLQRIT